MCREFFSSFGIYQMVYFFILKYMNLPQILHAFNSVASCAARFLGHLSRRLIGELIVYPWSGVRRRRPQCSNIYFSETDWPIKAKFYVEPPWVGGTKFCLRQFWFGGHMTKMATTPIYGKKPSKIFSRTGRPIFTKLDM